MKWLKFSAVLLVATLGTAGAKTTLIERGSLWKYDDSGANPGKTWNAAGFDDSDWTNGKGPLGYGDQGMTTTLSFGSDPKQKHAATFFRHEFTIPEGNDFAKLNAELRCDDGAAIYLNGKSIGRFNLGSDPVTHETLARVPLSGAQELAYGSFSIKISELKPGKNILAVSVHQASVTSSDLVFDLGLVGLTEAELPKRGMLGEGAREAVDAYHKGHFVAPEMSIPDGYVDGGTYMKIKDDGTVVATREVITVDRKRDKKLREYLEFAKSTTDLPPLERATKLAKYVDTLTTPPEGRRFAEAATRKLQDFRNAEILLGEVADYCGGGVCRHRSLLFKLLGDEAGLDVGLRRGQMIQRGRAIGRHAWNEITLPDGSLRVVDVMNPEPDFILPPAEDVSSKYGDIKGKPLYKKKTEPEAEEQKKKALVFASVVHFAVRVVVTSGRHSFILRWRPEVTTTLLREPIQRFDS